MKNIKLKLLMMLVLAGLVLTGCDMLDPTEVENPAITEDNLFEDATGGAEPLILGLEFAFSDAVNRAVIYSEVASDNYDNVSTYISIQLDEPAGILPNEMNLNDTREIYFRLQRLNALANFGFSTVLPKDENATARDSATVYFYRGLARLLMAENFLAFPVVPEGGMVRSEDALQLAIDDFNSASVNGYGNAVYFALARAYRMAGDKAKAVENAEMALAADSLFLFATQQDAINLTNRAQLFTLRRTGSNDMQPLPSLDFQDPKFIDSDSPISVLKSEEMLLILAEADIANGNPDAAKSKFKDLLRVVGDREVIVYADADPRDNRPTGANLLVEFAGSSDQYGDLVIERGVEHTYSEISNTSVTAAEIDAQVSDLQVKRLLFKLRQEIFFSEGRRMSDLGIRLPVMQRAIDMNPLITAGAYGTEVFVPDFIPPGDEMDAFSVVGDIVTIQHDMNKKLAENFSSVSSFQ